MEQLAFPGVDTTSEPKPFDANGGRKSLGRTKLLEILKTRTEAEVAREVRCSPEFISMLSCGRRKPGNWKLMDRIWLKLRISRESWEDRGSLLIDSIPEKQLQLDEEARYVRGRIEEHTTQLAEYTERLAAIEEERTQLASIGSGERVGEVATP